MAWKVGQLAGSGWSVLFLPGLSQGSLPLVHLQFRDPCPYPSPMHIAVSQDPSEDELNAMIAEVDEDGISSQPPACV